MSKLLLEKEIEIIQRFFDYDLSEEELNDFDRRLNSDADFANEVENYRLSYNTIDQLVHKNRNADISSNSVDQPRKQQAAVVQKKSPLVWLLPILLLGLLVTGYFILQPDSNTNDEQIFAQADEYTRLMSDDILRGDDVVVNISEEEKQLKSIILSYQSSDASPTIVALNDFISQSENLVNEELAEWWLANIYLQEKDMANAKKILTRIKDNSNYNSSKKAASFLEQL